MPSSPDSSDSDAPLIQYRKRISQGEQTNELKRSNETAAGTSYPVKKRKVRKSMKGKTRLAKQERKFKRNLGLKYITARTCQPLHDCRMKCRERFTDADRQMFVDEYWGAVSHEKRVNFVTSLIKKFKKGFAKEKKLTGRFNNRQYSQKYFLRINGIENKICKVCFRKTLGETNKFLELCSMKLSTSHTGIYESDRRGRQPQKKNTRKPT